MEIAVGQAVELMGVENAGLDITGQRGIVTEIHGYGLISVSLDGSGSIVSAWPENLKIVSSVQVADGCNLSAMVGQSVELIGVEHDDLEVNGKRGTIIEAGREVISVRVDGSGEVVAVKPQSLRQLAS